MKKVLFFTSQFPTYSETFVVRQVESLIQQGFDVQILSLLPGDSNTSIDPDVLAPLIDKTRYVLKEKQGTIAKLIYRALLLCVCLLNKQGRKILNFRKNSGNSFSLLAAICGELIQGKQHYDADVIIAHFGNNAVLADKLRDLGFLSGKIFAIFHGFDISSTQFVDQYTHDYQRLFESNMMALPVSELWANKLKTLGCPSAKINVHRMGVDTHTFMFNPINTAITPPLNILSVARLTEKKGLSYAIDAIHTLIQQGVDARYTIIGTGPLFEELDTKIKSLKLSAHIILAGFQDQSAIHTALENSDLFLLPSVVANDGDMEGIPVSLMEAMAKGVLCLSTFHSGIPELIENNISGLLVPERDANAIANTLTALLSRNDIAQLKQHARHVIEQHFDQNTLGEELAALIHDNG